MHPYILLICLMPPYAVKYGYVQLFMVSMVVYGYQWLFMVMYGYVWLCMVIYRLDTVYEVSTCL